MTLPAIKAGFRFLILLATSSDVIQELRGTAAQCLGDLHDILQTDVPLSSFDTPHERPVNASLIRKSLDRMIFKFGDTAWTYRGINPNAGPLYILFPLLTKDEQELMRFQIMAFVEAKKKREKKRAARAA